MYFKFTESGAIGQPGRVVKCPVVLEDDLENENAIVHLLMVAVAIAGALPKPSSRAHQTRVQVLIKLPLSNFKDSLCS